LVVCKLQKEILRKYAPHGVQTKTSSCNVTNTNTGKQYKSMRPEYEQTLEVFTEPTDKPFDSGEEVLGIPKEEQRQAIKHGKNEAGKGTDLDTKTEKWSKH
jgi:hypothetical protein